jgi:hypothetical protein
MGGMEGLFVSLALLALPFVILWVLIRLLPPWDAARTEQPLSPPSA